MVWFAVCEQIATLPVHPGAVIPAATVMSESTIHVVVLALKVA